MRIKTFGPVDERSLKQLERCMAAGGAEFGVLCADHHPGYSQPIGGGIAYEGCLSPSGVGYDIGCISAGARVSLDGGLSRPIESVCSNDPVSCLHEGRQRPVRGLAGAVRQGAKPLVRLELANDRVLALTADHLLRTREGWVEAGELAPAADVLCVPTIGHRLDRYQFPPQLVRLLAYLSAGRHLTHDGKRVSIYTTVAGDAEALIEDLEELGLEARVVRRSRPTGRRPEIHIYVDSRRFHRTLGELGSPVGRKRWPSAPMRWLLEAPAWVRAHFLSAFASAEMTAPRVVGGCIANLAIKQADEQAARLVAELLGSLGFTTSLALSSGQWLVQILGGEAAQLRFIEEIGFCRAYEKRLAAARAASVAWQRRELLRTRDEAQTETEILYAAGVGGGLAVRGSGLPELPRVEGEGVWVSVRHVRSAGQANVWDVVTGDTAESFVANGVVVHNCGNKAVRTGLTRPDLEALGGVDRIMGEVTRRISFGMGVPAQERTDHQVLDRIRSADFAPQRRLARLAEDQLGTVGSGNHFVNLFEDEEGLIWVGVHFGSRGFGHRTASGFLALAQGLPFDTRPAAGAMDSPPVLFEAGSELGMLYVSAMHLAGDYAYAGRDVVCARVLEILGAERVHEVHNHHNFAWQEQHFGRTVWVIRKGCTPARPGQEGFVGGSMGDDSVILEGVESAEAAAALDSTVHGAGRIMSRSRAAGRVRRRKRLECSHRDCNRLLEPGETCPEHPTAGRRKVLVEEQVKPGAVDWPAVQERLRRRGIVLVGGAADEAPEVYKRLPEVLAAHAGSIRVKHTLRPLGVAMAGRDVVDPYKD